jgi:hypothetical protein
MELSLQALVLLLWKASREEKARRKMLRRGPSRDPRYMAWIRTLPCAVCGSKWRVEAAHTGSDGGMAQKASDYSCVPLCRYCHTGRPGAYHRIGKGEFARAHGVNLGELVKALNLRWEDREAVSGGEPACQR